MGASDAVLRIGVGYTRVMLGGEASIILLFIANAIFRGAGDAAIAMRTLWLANGINIVLGPMLIFGVGPFPELGVTGAAIATTIGRATGASYALWRLTRPHATAGSAATRVRVAGRHLRPDRAAIASLVRMSSSATLQTVIGTASWIGLVRIVATFGSDALAGYTIAIRVVVFAILPAWGMSNAAATLVGQALGAKDPARAERAVWMTAHYNGAFMGAVSVLFVLAAHPIVTLFTHDPAVVPIAVRCLRIVARGLPALRVRHGARPPPSTARATRARRRGSTSPRSGCSRSRSRGSSPCRSAGARRARSSPSRSRSRRSRSRRGCSSAAAPGSCSRSDRPSVRRPLTARGAGA